MLSQTVLPALSRLFPFVLPPSLWYRSALALSAAVAGAVRLTSAQRQTYRFEQALILNRLLALLTRHNRPFPVPWRMGSETRALLASATARGGLLLCSAHLPLVKVAARAFIEAGHAPAAAIAESPADDQAIAIWGLQQRLPALKVDPAVLLRTRTLLRAGESVILLVDRQAGAGYSPNIFRLAHSMRATVLFFIPELAADGTVDVRLVPPPHPACATPEQITENLQTLDAEVRQVSVLAERLPVPVYWEFGHRAVTLFVRLLTRLLSTSAFKTR